MCKQTIRIGVVVHGPEVIDSGSAVRILEYLKRYGNVFAVLGGTMGRLAVIDADLDNVIDISDKRTPSQSIRELGESTDLIILLNQAKTRETGIAFGAKVFANAQSTNPLIQIDCGGKFITQLAGKDNAIAEVIAKDLGIDLLGRPRLSKDVSVNGDIERRRIVGVLPGEAISINGIVIAKAKESSIEILVQNGRIIAVNGADIKYHGLEKLPLLELSKAIIRSGKIRRTKANPITRACSGYEAVIIDHCAEDAFEAAKGACIILTVGDDTTLIGGDILSRLSIPIVGIVDGDLDGLLHKPMISPGSVIIKVKPGCDDLVGEQVKELIFRGKTRIIIGRADLEEMVIKIAKDWILRVERF